MRRHMILEDRYELVDLLSRGGMGEVWRGFDRRLDRPVAIKGIRLDGGSLVIVSTYDLRAHQLESIRNYWDKWRAENYPTSDPLH